MNVQGYQKLTLLDYPGRTACTVFTGGCNLRCPFCHNAGLVRTPLAGPNLTDEVLVYLHKRRGILDGVCVTGGEPLLRSELPEFLRRIRALGYLVKLDTNGSHPQRLRQLLEEGLVDYVAMDIKNSPQRYGETIGRPDFDIAPIKESVSLLMRGAVDYEFRTTVVNELHDEEAFQAIAEWLRGAKRCFLQPFADRDTVPMAGLSAPDDELLSRYADILRETVPDTTIRGI